jgi:hypothetical protein
MNSLHIYVGYVTCYVHTKGGMREKATMLMKLTFWWEEIASKDTHIYK